MTGPGLRAPIRRIVVTVGVGRDLLAATDDPLFLELLGPAGREFRLQIAQGTALRRGSEDRFVLGAKSDPETNVANPELNDPTSPAIDAASVMGIALRKGLDPIPNVRGHGELDDRLQVLSVEVELHVDGEAAPRRWSRSGDFWLGLVSGLRLSLAPADPA